MIFDHDTLFLPPYSMNAGSGLEIPSLFRAGLLPALRWLNFDSHCRSQLEGIASFRKMKTDDSNAELFNCIDAGLKVFGDSVPQVVYWRLEQTSRLRKDDIPKRIDEFVSGLRSMFGAGLPSITRSIVRELRNRIGVMELDEQDLSAALVRARSELRRSNGLDVK